MESQWNGCPNCGGGASEPPGETTRDAAGAVFGVRSTFLPPCWRLADPVAARALAALAEATRRAVPAGRVLEVAGDPARAVYLVLEGWLAASKSTEGGQRQIVEFVLPGQVFEPAAAHGGRSALDLAAQSAARVAVIGRGEWARLLRAHPALHDLHDRHVAEMLARMAERMLRLGKGSAEMRVAHAVCELGLRAGAGDGARRAFHLPLTQQALGDYTGLSSVHVSRTFQRFRSLGILSVENCMDIVLHDPASLARIAGMDAAAPGGTALPRP